jgi:hypothetical protein
LVAASAHRWGDQVADPQRADTIADHEDPPDRLMAKHEEILTIGQRPVDAHRKRHNVAIGAADTNPQHLNDDVIRLAESRFGYVGEPGPAIAWTGDDRTHR